MVIHKCKRCNKVFSRKSHYMYHVYKRKTPCHNVSDDSSDNNEIKRPKIKPPHFPTNDLKLPKPKTGGSQEGTKMAKHVCTNCGRKFTRGDSVRRHKENSCPYKKVSDEPNIQSVPLEESIHALISVIKDQHNNKNLVYDDYDNEDFIEDDNYILPDNYTKDDIHNILKKTKNDKKQLTRKYTNEIKELKKCLMNKKVYNTQHNIQNIGRIGNDIKLIAFGDEDLSFISNEVYKKLIGRGFNSVPMLIKYVHFNKNRPEFHNIFVSNIQNTFTFAYNGKGWDIVQKKEAIRQLIDGGRDVLIDKFKELKKELPISSIKKFTNFMEQRDDEDVLDWMEKQVKMLLYNNRTLPMKLKNEMKQVTLSNYI